MRKRSLRAHCADLLVAGQRDVLVETTGDPGMIQGLIGCITRIRVFICQFQEQILSETKENMRKCKKSKKSEKMQKMQKICKKWKKSKKLEKIQKIRKKQKPGEIL